MTIASKTIADTNDEALPISEYSIVFKFRTMEKELPDLACR